MVKSATVYGFWKNWMLMVVAAVVTITLCWGLSRGASAQQIERYSGVTSLFYVYEIWVPGLEGGETKLVLRNNDDEERAILTDLSVVLTVFNEEVQDYEFVKINKIIPDKILGKGSRLELPVKGEYIELFRDMQIFTVGASGVGYVVNFRPCIDGLKMRTDGLELREGGFVCRYMPGSAGAYSLLGQNDYVRENFEDEIEDYLFEAGRTEEANFEGDKELNAGSDVVGIVEPENDQATGMGGSEDNVVKNIDTAYAEVNSGSLARGTQSNDTTLNERAALGTALGSVSEKGQKESNIVKNNETDDAQRGSKEGTNMLGGLAIVGGLLILARAWVLFRRHLLKRVSYAAQPSS